MVPALLAACKVPSPGYPASGQPLAYLTCRGWLVSLCLLCGCQGAETVSPKRYLRNSSVTGQSLMPHPQTSAYDALATCLCLLAVNTCPRLILSLPPVSVPPLIRFRPTRRTVSPLASARRWRLGFGFKVHPGPYGGPGAVEASAPCRWL